MKRTSKQRLAKAAPRKPAAREVTRQLPMMTREAPITNVAVDGENRIVSLLWTGGEPVRRYDWGKERYYIEELSIQPEHVRMGRLARTEGSGVGKERGSKGSKWGGP